MLHYIIIYYIILYYCHIITGAVGTPVPQPTILTGPKNVNRKVFCKTFLICED